MKERKSSTAHGQPFEREMTLCLQDCFEDLESGDPTRLARWVADPYFEREPVITGADADRLIAALDEEYGKEVDQYPSYHKRRSGANAKPDWWRLEPSHRLGLAQRLARIADSFE